MKQTIRAIVKHPGEEYGFMANVYNDLEAFQNIIGGRIETVTYMPDTVIMCDEEGRLKELPYNITFSGVDFVGTIIVAGVDGEDFTDVPFNFQTWKGFLDLQRREKGQCSHE